MANNEAGQERSIRDELADIFKPKAAKPRREAGRFVGNGTMFILFSILLYGIDMFAIRFNGINIRRFLDNLAFTSLESYIGWFFNSIVLTLLIVYWVIYRPTDPREFVSIALVIEAVSLILFLGGMGTILIHLVIVGIFYFLFIRDFAENKVTANYVFLILLLFDFFGYGLLAEFVNNPVVSNRLIIPIWFYFSLIYAREQERGGLVTFLIILVVLLNVFYFVGGINGLRNMMAGLTPEEIQEGLNFWTKGWGNLKTVWGNIKTGFREGLERQLEYATGGYYKGKVEKNKVGPLGVFIDKLKTSQPRYYQSEKVIIWGTVKALSLGEGVNIKINCHKKNEKPDINKITVIPDKTFTMYSLETRDFECQFSPGSLPSGEMNIPFTDKTLHPIGIHTITIDAEFNFGTLAYLKSYFMDLERKRGMVREGLDPFKEFGIKDTSPIAVYTDGPVIIGMETTSPIIEVGEGIITRPRLGITLENREGWEGVIRSLSELVLLTPPGVEILHPDSDCGDVKFKNYSKDNCDKGFCCYDEGSVKRAGGKITDLENVDKIYQHEKGSCERFVFQSCVDVCIPKEMAKEKYKGETEEEARKKAKEVCLKKEECKRDFKNCVNDCEVLFEGEQVTGSEEGKIYKGYALDTTQLLVVDMFKDIDRFRSFSCRLDVNTNVLENTPITVKYFRAKVRYNYTLSKDIDVEIQAKPGTAVDISLKIDVTGFIPKKIVEIARKPGISVDEMYALGIAAVESNFRHCCASSSATKYGDCIGTEEVDCQSRVIAGDDGMSIGVMQINRLAGHTNAGKPCYGMNIYNLEDNIKCGLKILKANYDLYKDGIPEPTVRSKCSNEEYIKKYMKYRNWDAALRAYNGLGCSDKVVNYVEKVIAAKELIESKGGLIDLTGGILTPEEIRVAPSEIAEGGNVDITWKASSQTKVDSYKVYRIDIDGKKEEIKKVDEKGDPWYSIKDIPKEGTYTYYVVNVVDIGGVPYESKPSEKKQVTVIKLEPPKNLKVSESKVGVNEGFYLKWDASPSEKKYAISYSIVWKRNGLLLGTYTLGGGSSSYQQGYIFSNTGEVYFEVYITHKDFKSEPAKSKITVE